MCWLPPGLREWLWMPSNVPTLAGCNSRRRSWRSDAARIGKLEMAFNAVDRVLLLLICYTASWQIPFQQVLGAQQRGLENEHRPPSGMQVCCPTLATEVKEEK